MTDADSSLTLILGAGLTGLSCAHHLKDGGRYRLLEKEDSVGGLARTRKRPQGFLCDGTGHWLHLRNDVTKKFVADVMGDNIAPRERRARVYSQGVYTLYPFQANTYGLPKEVVAECLLGLYKARHETEHPPAKNYLEWIRQQFGEGICKHFMEPYNAKIYGVPLDTLAADFAAKYIPQPSFPDVVSGALGMSKQALGYNASFLYPKTGGIGALPDGIHKTLDREAERGRHPVAIDLKKRWAKLDGGEEVNFDHLVTTIPLTNFVDLCLAGNPDCVPDSVVEAKSKLRANSVLYFDVAIRGKPKEHQDYHWIYLPESNFPFYRVGSYSAVEPSLAPAECRSYYVEMGHYGDVDPSQFEQGVMDGLRRLGILGDEDELIFMVPNVLSPAYVLFDHNYEASRKAVLDWTVSQNVISVGRYGRWQYNAMEDAMLEGRQAALDILEGKA